MKKKVVFGVGIWLVGAVIICNGTVGRLLQAGDKNAALVVQAGKASEDIQKQIDDVGRERQSVQQEKEKLENDIALLEEKKGNILEYIETLDVKLAELSDKIEANEKDIAAIQKQITALREDKKEAEADQKKQYDTMASRIKYMYENGNDGYLELLFGAGSLSELFNRAEYVTKVTNYDKQMLGKYQKICEKIQKMEEELEKKLTDLKQLKESLKLEKDSVNELMDKKTKQLKEYQSAIDDKNKAVEMQKSLIQKQEKEMERLLEIQRIEIEKERAEAAKKRASEDSPQAGVPIGIQYQSGGYQWPLAVSGRISSYFGYRTAPTAGASTYHKGIDIAVPTGTDVLAAQSGKVVTAAYSSSAGNYVAIYHGSGTYTYYMHCSKLTVSAGTEVSKGQRIALSGSTGVSTGPHLHFAVYAGGTYVNPLKYVSAR